MANLTATYDKTTGRAEVTTSNTKAVSMKQLLRDRTNYENELKAINMVIAALIAAGAPDRNAPVAPTTTATTAPSATTPAA